MRIKINNRGAILIMALWTMAFLGIIASYIGLRVRQRVDLLSRIEGRSQLRFLAEAGIRKSIVAISKEMDRSNKTLTPQGRRYLSNNEADFKNIVLGFGHADVAYSIKESLMEDTYYGVVDEESKINLNTVPLETLSNLFMNAGSVHADQAHQIAQAIVDWRGEHSAELVGFESDNYYSNLAHSYEQKRAPFELPDELLLVRGMTPDIYKNILPFITVYGDGVVNINTASQEVLSALGLSIDVVQKILLVREGADHREKTEDDYFFRKTYDIAIEMKGLIELSVDEVKQIDLLNQNGKIKTNSSIFFSQAYAVLDRNKQQMFVQCVYDSNEHRIKYWRER
jgi:type II secretory pathway component PulK